MIDLDDREFGLLKEYLLQSCGIDVSPEKKYLFKTRLHDLLVEEKLSSYSDLYQALVIDMKGRLQKKVIEYMTTNETSFFRDLHPFEALLDIVLPRIRDRKKKEQMFMPAQLKIWSAGCSTGQEPYSIAMVLLDWLPFQDMFTADRISLLATDISAQVLEKAREGVYEKSALSPSVMEKYGKKHFKLHPKTVEVNEQVKRMITFAELNLSGEFADKYSGFDILFCRNVIIYFALELKKRILIQFHKLLSPGGILVLGASENLYKISEDFDVEHHGDATFYRAK